MDWEGGKAKGYAYWKFMEISSEFFQLKCTDSKWGHFVGRKLESSNFEKTFGEVVAMTLKSHPGKALVLDTDRNYVHEGYAVRWFKLGEAKDALKCVFKKTASGYFILLDHERTHQFDVASGKYEDGNEVLSWRRHYGGNQLFVVFDDMTISPAKMPYHRLGIRDNMLKLVSKDSKDEILVFDGVTPT